MPGNTAGRQAVFAFDIRFFEMAGAPGREFDSTKDVPVERVRFMETSIDDVVSNEGGVTDAELSAVFDYRPVRTPEFPVYQRKIELNANTIGKIVTNEDLRYGTVDVLVNGVWDFAAVLLECAEMSELLSKAAKKTGIVDALSLCGGVDRAEVAGKRWLDASGCQNGRKQNFHTEQSVKLIK